MFERRMFILVAALVVLLASAALWNAFVRPPARASAGATPDTAPVQTVVRTAGSAIDSARDTAHAAAAPTPPPTVVPPVGAGGPSYIVLLARSEIRRRIRASAGSTYLNDNLTQNADSILHRWDGRVSTPVRVFFPPTTVANFQPSFLDAVRSAFQRWQEVVPVRFNLDADSSSAEVRVQWRIQFEGERSGQTDVQWDEDGRLGPRGGADRAASRPRGALLRVRAPVPRQARAPGDLQGPLQQGRDAVRPRRLHRRPAVRSDREEAVLPRPPRLRHTHLRYAGMRFPLWVLPELAHEPGAARRRRRRSPDGRHPGRPGSARAATGSEARRAVLQRAAHHRRVGARRVQGGARPWLEDRVYFERQCDARGARFHPPLDRLLQDRLQGDGGSPLPGAGRRAPARARCDPDGVRARILARAGDPRGPGIQR